MNPAPMLLVGLMVSTVTSMSTAPPVTVTLVRDAPVKAGDTPSFDVTITNRSGASVKVVAGGKLQRWYYHPHVTQNGKEVWLPTGCDLPTAPDDTDYVVVPPHGSYSFVLSEYSGSWRELKPGNYRVVVSYDHFRYHEKGYTALSNEVVLQVTR